jgi:hypothetical protein
MKLLTISPVAAMHVVKGRQYSAHIRLPQSRRWSLRPTLDLESDKSRCRSHRDELDSAVQLLKLRSVGRGRRAIYSTR